MSDRIQLRHPQGKRAPSIQRDRYELIRRIMLATVPAKAPGITWVRLRTEMDRRLGKRLEGGNNWWHTHAVKMHLEAIGDIERVTETPQRLVRAKRR